MSEAVDAMPEEDRHALKEKLLRLQARIEVLGSLLDGVHFRGHFAETETVVMRSQTGTVRRIKTTFRMIGTKAA